MADLATAQGQLDEKERELAAVQAEYDKAMAEKQVNTISDYVIQCCKIVSSFLQSMNV